MKRELTCIGCPMGCALTVSVDGENIEVSGNTCPRGEDYARKEVTDPRRIVTSTVKVTGGKEPVVSCKTEHDIPKGMIFDCVKALAGITVPAPIRIGDTLLDNVCGTGVRIIATKNVEKG